MATNNNEQFRKSITHVINDAHLNALIKLQKAEQRLKENPRSYTLKEERIGALRAKQAYEHIKLHIDNGSFDSVEYWDKYLDPMSEFQRTLRNDKMKQKDNELIK